MKGQADWPKIRSDRKFAAQTGKKVPMIRKITRLFLSSLLSVWRYKWLLWAFSVVPMWDFWAGPAEPWLTSRCGCSGTGSGMTPRIILFVPSWNEVELFQTLPGPAWPLDAWWWLCFHGEGTKNKQEECCNAAFRMRFLGFFYKWCILSY